MIVLPIGRHVRGWGVIHLCGLLFIVRMRQELNNLLPAPYQFDPLIQNVPVIVDATSPNSGTGSNSASKLRPGVDEVSLALVADAWSRTYRSRAVTFAGTDGTVETRNGIRILPDRIATSWPTEQVLPVIGGPQPARALDDALRGIASRYGSDTANVVAMQLEYPRSRAPQ